MEVTITQYHWWFDWLLDYGYTAEKKVSWKDDDKDAR